MTKRIEEFSCLDKTYTGKITIGSTTPSYDLETKPNVIYPINHITNELIISTSKKFVGKILQKPPIFSAVKKDGVRLYKLARKGVDVKVEKREIQFYIEKEQWFIIFNATPHRQNVVDVKIPEYFLKGGDHDRG